MWSSECGKEDPSANNAWILGALKENIIACKTPDYLKDPAPNIGYVACERTISASCPASFDGTSNAFILKTAENCVKEAVNSGCDDGLVKIAGVCVKKTASDCYPENDMKVDDMDGGFFVAVKKGSGKEIAYDIFPPPPGSDRCDYSVTRISKPSVDYWPLCIIGNEYIFKVDYARLVIEYAVRRLFYNPMCMGTPGEINAMVVRKSTKPAEALGVDLCVAPRTWNPYRYRKMVGDELGDYSADESARHSDACGLGGVGPDRLNAIRR
ncbi:hypothetical protein [Paraburkholderia terrae]|uniref:hypothetical protein n=1 Tax=Paraburkholderia terrae TaxID=311230 RepID=UPI0020C1150D|nr:hypothetical protein [Paraburkholderia terrae]